MEHLKEVAKIAEWGIKGDAARVSAYLSQLIEKLSCEDDKKAVQRLHSVLADSGPNIESSAIGAHARLPVDSESRLALADEEAPRLDEFPVILDSTTSHRIEEFISFVKNADELEAHGVGLSPSLISYGPPGTGKTQLARYIAGRLNMPLVIARADTLISSYLGSTSKNLRTLFEHVGHRHCILFLDELDAFAKLRDDQQELGELKRVVVSLLQNLDNMNPHTILIAATNHDHLLDPAIWRRFTFKIPLHHPSVEERDRLLVLYLGHYMKGLNKELLAEISESLSGSDLRTISQDAIRDAVIRKKETVDQDRLVWRIAEARLKQDIDFANPSPKNLQAVQSLNPHVFTGKKIAEMFKTSTSTVSRRLKQEVTK